MANIIHINSFSIPKDGFHFEGAIAFISDKKVLLLNRKWGTTLLIEQDLLTALTSKQVNDEFQFKLVVRGFAKVEGSPDIFDSRSLIEPTFFIIDMTNFCNMSCRYCFRNLISTPKFISEEQLKKICNYIITYCKCHNIEHFFIQPWGGEPLLAFDKIKYAQDYFNNHHLHPTFSIETNTTLLTPSMAQELFNRRIRVGISIDGNEEIHNLQRIFNSGKGSYIQVIKGINLLRDVGYKNNFGSISVITKNSVSKIELILDCFVKELRLKNLKFNIIRTTADNPIGLTDEEVKDFNIRLVKKLCSLYEEGYEMTEGNILEKISNLLARKNRNICKSRGCMGGRRMVSINKEGNIFPCEMTDFPSESIGNLDQGKDLQIMIKEAIAQKKGYFNERSISECETCPWWYYCRGGCATAVKYQSDNYEGIDKLECVTNKTIYPLLVDIILEKPQLVNKFTGGMLSFK